MVDLFAIDGFNSDNPESDHADDELDVYQKLAISQRGNEIYRQQLRYMQDHLTSLRSLIQDKENIIENLTMRFDLGILKSEKNQKTKDMDEIQLEEMCRKAENLAQRTILENFQLRETIDDLKDQLKFLRKEMSNLDEAENWNTTMKDNAMIEEVEDIAVTEEEDNNATVEAEKDSVEQLREQVRSLEKELDHLRNKEFETVNAGANITVQPLKELKEIAALEKEVVKLRRLKVHFAEFRILFGCSFKSLIPYQLNENALMKYGLLFDGYYRNIVDDALIPKEVSKLISFYYPIFWTLETNFVPTLEIENDMESF